MLETCRGSWCSINWIKSSSRWFHYTDIPWCTVSKTLNTIFISFSRPCLDLPSGFHSSGFSTETCVCVCVCVCIHTFSLLRAACFVHLIILNLMTPIIQCVRKVAVHLQKALEVTSTSVYTGLNQFNFIRKHFPQICGIALQPLFNNWIQWNNSALHRQLRYWQTNLRTLA
jgi:hypothetical protein